MEYVLVKTDLNVRLGPGIDYDVVGLISGGQIARVTGVSLDGAWWRIFCADDPSGIGWVSAMTDLTPPTTSP